MAIGNYIDQITAFLQDNFTPSTPDVCNVKYTSDGLLSFLFQVFPPNCISELELDDILQELGYSRHTYVVDRKSTNIKGDNETTIVEKALQIGWCLLTALNLDTEVYSKPIEPKQSTKTKWEA